MFLRLVADSFGRRPRHKLLTGAALALALSAGVARAQDTPHQGGQIVNLIFFIVHSL